MRGHHVLQHIATLTVLILFKFSYLFDQIRTRVDRRAESTLGQFLANPVLQVARLVGTSMRILIL